MNKEKIKQKKQFRLFVFWYILFLGALITSLIFLNSCDSTKGHDWAGKDMPEPTVNLIMPEKVTVGETFTIIIEAPPANRERYVAHMNYGYQSNTWRTYPESERFDYKYKDAGVYMVVVHCFNSSNVAKQCSKRIIVKP